MSIDSKFSELVHDEANIREIIPGIFSMFTEDVSNSYDEQGAMAFYDSVACNSLYNRIAWGYHITKLHNFCSDLLKTNVEGWHLDAGCGSLAFTNKAYANTSRPLVLMDQSLTLLKKAQKKMRLKGMKRGNIILLQGDVTEMPFKDNIFRSVISMNMLHVMKSEGAMLDEIKRVATPQAALGFSTLYLSGRWSDAYLKKWEDKGEVVCRDMTCLRNIFESNKLEMDIKSQGNMAFAKTTMP